MHVSAAIYYLGPSILLFHKHTISLGKGLYFPSWAKPTLIGGTEGKGHLIVRRNQCPLGKDLVVQSIQGNLNVQGYQAHPP